MSSPILVIPPALFGSGYIIVLVALVAAAQQNDQRRAIPGKVDPIAGTEVNPALNYAFAYTV